MKNRTMQQISENIAVRFCRSFIRRIRKTALGVVQAVGVVVCLAIPVQSQSFGNQAIQFPEDTTVEFEFIVSEGAYRSTLGIINLDTGQEVVLFREGKPYDNFVPGQPFPKPISNDFFMGTVDGGTVPNRFSEFTFKANNRYAFYLESVSPSGQTTRTVRSVNQLAATFEGSLNSGSNGDRTGSRILWDDDGLPGEEKDSDFNDFVIEAGGYLITTPCPSLK